MLKITNLNKKFKSVVIADDISVELENVTYGLLGRNGSGKTTLLRMITQIEKIDSGKIEVFDDNGQPVKNYLEKIGYLPQSFDIFNTLTCAEVLQFFANLKEVKITPEEIDSILASLNLTDKKNTLVKKLSGGMKRRLGIGQSLIGKPEILLLDEPTSGLDPEERVNFKNVVRREKRDRCVVLSTHIITDIESLCDRILVLNGGKITEFSSCDELKKVADGKVFAVENVNDLSCRYHTMETVVIDSKTYDRVICEQTPENAIPLEATVEDGYICFIEGLK